MLKEDNVDRLATNFELKIKIVIECEDELVKRELVREYYDKAKDHASFSEEKFIEVILHNKFTFL